MRKVISLFVQQAILSFFVGASVVLLVTIAAEKLGSKIGGIASGLPGSVMVSLVFIGIQHGPTFAARTATTIPAMLGVVCIFLTVYAALPGLSFLPRFLIALGTWLALALSVGFLGLHGLNQTLPILIVVCLACFVLLEYWLHIPSVKPIKIHYTKSQLAFRALAAGLTIVTVLFISKTAGSVWGGVASVYPVANIVSLIILQKTASLDFTRAMCKASILSVTFNTGTFVILAHVLYPSVGLALGTILALAASVIVAYGTLEFMRRRVR